MVAHKGRRVIRVIATGGQLAISAAADIALWKNGWARLLGGPRSGVERWALARHTQVLASRERCSTVTAKLAATGSSAMASMNQRP